MKRLVLAVLFALSFAFAATNTAAACDPGDPGFPPAFCH